MYGKLPRQIVSSFGYQGCLASLELNGEAADPINNALIPSDFVNDGCEGETVLDRPHSILDTFICTSVRSSSPLFYIICSLQIVSASFTSLSLINDYLYKN